ncbi:putative pectinesterase [Helianthus annuus]|nr:putative pectinesterase [Helianthus annuus]
MSYIYIHNYIKLTYCMSNPSNKNITIIIMPLLLLLLFLFASSLLLPSSQLNHANTIITSSCSTTLYPDICYNTLSDITHTHIATKKDVIQLTLNKTKDIIEANYHTITNLITSTTTPKMALLDCLDMEAANLEQLHTLIQYLTDYPTKKPLPQYADDLNTLMSTIITNKETCLDALSQHDHSECSNPSHEFITIQDHQELGGKMCSNALAMIKSMTDTDIAANNQEFNKPVGQAKKGITWPEWLSARDRKLFKFVGMRPNVIVAKNGKGNFTTVQAAVDAAPNKSTRRFVIKITAGTYKEYVNVPRSKHNIMFVGDGRDQTIITGNKNVAACDGTTTTTSATVGVLGEGFLARDITFQNTAGASGHQAVALRVGSDLSAFYKCGFEGYQDTLYVHSNRQFYIKCFITGTIDFIFGNAAAVFQSCDIMIRKPNPRQSNMVTAQGRTDKNQATGIVIHKCNIRATNELKAVQKDFPTYLGRPWKEFSRTVVMGSIISDVIRKEGWYPWDGDFALDTLYYREYQNSGPGSNTSKRVRWKGWGVIKDKNEARQFTVARFINGWGWLPHTDFPFWPGL